MPVAGSVVYNRPPEGPVEAERQVAPLCTPVLLDMSCPVAAFQIHCWLESSCARTRQSQGKELLRFIHIWRIQETRELDTTSSSDVTCAPVPVP